MAEEKKIPQETEAQPLATEQQPAERPNRTAYAKMLSEDYPDLDFEDKETRYGRMVEDRKHYKDLVKAGKGLSSVMDKQRWLGAMIRDLAANPEMDPVTWMYENGIDVAKAMENEEYRKEVADKLGEFQKKQSEGEQAAREREANLDTSFGNLVSLGLSDEDTNALWAHFFGEVLDPALRGEVSKETWQALRNAQNYDSDIKNAREEGGMQARNEKIQNKVKTFDEEQVPPSFTQGSGQRVTPKRKKAGFFDDLKDYH